MPIADNGYKQTTIENRKSGFSDIEILILRYGGDLMGVPEWSYE